MKTILNNHFLRWTTVEFGRKDIRSILFLLLILFFSANRGEGQQETDFPSNIELEQEFNRGFILFPGSSRGAQDKLDQAWRYFEEGQYELAQDMVQLHARRSRKLTEEYAFLEARIKYELAEYEDDPVARDREFRVASSLFAVLLFDSPKSDRVVEVAYWQAKSEYQRSEYEKTVWLLNNPEGSFRDRADKFDNDSVKIDGVLLLSESYLGMLDPVNARNALLEMDAFTVQDPLQAWSRLYIIFKAHLMENRFKEVLENIGDLYDLVERVTEPSYKTMTLDIHGRILESLNRENEAVKVYKEILYSEETAEILVRRENLEHIIHLLNRDDQLPGLVKAIEFVVDFNRNFSSDGTQDLADLNLAELYLLRSSRLDDVSEEARPSNKAAYLHQASTYADRAIDRWPQHPAIGRAFIVRGWGKWESENFSASRAAFQVALDWFSRSKTMKRSVYEAEARYKYADCHLVQKNYSQAVENYNKLLQDYQDVEYAPIKARFFAGAIQHLIEAQLGLGDANAALLLKDRLVREFPNSEHTASALIRMGTELRWLQRPSESRAVLDQFLKMLPDHNSVSDVLRTRARTFMDEANWTAAFGVLNRWKSEYSDSPDLPLVQFEIAWIMARSGEESAALLLFEEFLKENNNHALVAAAKEWIASHS
ncbi:MAG TPA: tetratricopeptide repeat protein, partial [Verrucomicrobiales bacterium]|nr:tetratricopeptide repeat protein [Verrucomicrobiales bacterium]